jgi:hypothetical protein
MVAVGVGDGDGGQFEVHVQLYDSKNGPDAVLYPVTVMK